MRILHTSDWHLGKSLEQISRLEEQREFIECLDRIVEENNIDLVLIAGDIYDTYNPSAAAEELFYEAIDRLSARGRRAVVVIAGNHDNPERLCAASPLAFKNGIILLGYPGSDAGEAKNGKQKIASSAVSIVQSGPGWLEIGISGCEHNAVLVTLPYPSEARLEEVLSAQAEEGILQKAYSDKIGSIFASRSEHFREDTVNLAMGHIFLMGGKESESERTLQVGGALTVNPGVLPAKAHFAALGHLHKPQEIKHAPCPAFYSGSPLAYSFSEADYSKAVYIVEAQPGLKAEIRAVYLDCGKPLRRWVAQNGIEEAIKWCEEGRDLNAWVDLEVVTDRILTSDEQKRLRSKHAGIVNIRPRLKSEETEILSGPGREGRKIDELFSDHFKYRTGLEISEELMGAFLEVINDQEDDLTAGGEEDEA